MRLISEITEEVKFTEELVELAGSAGVQKKHLHIEGIFLQGGIVNRNKRMYPLEVLEGEVNRYNEERIAKGQGYGELGHPQGPMINLERVSHMTTSLKRDGNNFMGKARLADTPYGNIAKGLHESGARLGVSSRGLGNVVANKSGIMEVQKDFRLAAAADIVADPSAPDAFVNGIMENADWVCDPSGHWQRVEQIVESVKKMSKRELEEQAISSFNKYMKALIK